MLFFYPIWCTPTGPVSVAEFGGGIWSYAPGAPGSVGLPFIYSEFKSESCAVYMAKSVGCVL